MTHYRADPRALSATLHHHAQLDPICVPTQAHDLYMSDFPTHDMAADFVLLAEQRQVESDLKEQYEVGA